MPCVWMCLDMFRCVSMWLDVLGYVWILHAKVWMWADPQVASKFSKRNGLQLTVEHWGMGYAACTLSQLQ